MKPRLGVLVSHPIQYYAPFFRELGKRTELSVFYAHRQSAEGQAAADFGIPFEWDVDLLSGYHYRFLANAARRPDVSRFSGCDCPEIGDVVRHGPWDAFLVMGWYLKAYWQAIRACRKNGVPVLVRGDSRLAPVRRSISRRGLAWLTHGYIVRQFDALLYVGTKNREYLEHFGAPSERLFFSPHCVDNEWFRERAQRADAGPAPGPVLFVGKLVARKRPEDLLRAAAAMTRPVSCAFVGTGPLEQPLRRLARELGVDARFLGFRNQTELPALLSSASLIALPSDESETWGLVVNEAMACGTLAVVSDAVGCGPDLVEPGVTGETFPVGDVSGFALAIARALELSLQPGTSRALAERMTRYSPSRAADGVLEALDALGAGGMRVA